jgi:hypothetical protein
MKHEKGPKTYLPLRYRGSTNIIPQVLVNVCFCRVSTEKNQGRSTCQVYIETKGLHITSLECGRYEKTLEINGRRNGPESGVPTPVARPIRRELVDPTSTAFEDE